MCARGWICLLLLFIAGCEDFPRDPDKTFERARGGSLRVGVVHVEPWAWPDESGEPAGREPKLIRLFANEIDAEVTWTWGGESQLFHRLEKGELDVVAGDVISTTPWSKSAAFTRPFFIEETSQGPRKHVIATRLGENAFLIELDAFLQQQKTILQVKWQEESSP